MQQAAQLKTGLTQGEIEGQLNRLALLREHRAQIVAEIERQIQTLEDTKATLAGDVDREITQTEAEIRTGVLALGRTVTGERLRALYTKGRVSWDTRMLQGLALAHKEIMHARKVGQPSVSIRVAVP